MMMHNHLHFGINHLINLCDTCVWEWILTELVVSVYLWTTKTFCERKPRDYHTTNLPGARGSDACYSPLTPFTTSARTRTHTLPLSFPPVSSSPPSWPNALQGRAEWWALWWHVYGGSEQQGTLPGVVAQVIHYNVTSKEEMKQSQSPCVQAAFVAYWKNMAGLK